MLRDSGIYGMNIDFNRALDSFNVVILDFDLRGFIRKDTVLPKAQYVFVVSFLVKVFRT